MSAGDERGRAGDEPVEPAAGPGPASDGPAGPAAGHGRAGDDLPEDPMGGPDHDGGGILAAWRRTYGASPLHLLLHLAAIALIAWALSQSFDGRYSKAYVNLAIWTVGGAILNDFVAIPLYVGIDRLARGLWGAVRPGRGRRGGEAASPATAHGTGGPAGDGPAHAAAGPGRATDAAAPGLAPGAPLPAATRVRGNGHVRVPVVMSAVLLLVYFPNITHKAPIGHRLSTGLPEQPDWAARWLAITAGLLLASAAIYAVRLALARRRERAAA
jgi:hypothetical protein